VNNNSSEDIDRHSHEFTISTIVGALSDLSIHDALNVVDGVIKACKDSVALQGDPKDLFLFVSRIREYPPGLGPLNPAYLRHLSPRTSSRDSDFVRMHFYDCLERATSSGRIAQPELLTTPAVQDRDEAEIDRRAIKVAEYLVGNRIAQAIDLLAQGLVKWVWSLAEAPVVQYVVDYKNDRIWKYYGTEKCRMVIAFLIHEWYF
jgi:hypothetical protein